MLIATKGSVTVRIASTGAMSELSWNAFWLSRNPSGSATMNAYRGHCCAQFHRRLLDARGPHFRVPHLHDTAESTGIR